MQIDLHPQTVVAGAHITGRGCADASARLSLALLLLTSP